MNSDKFGQIRINSDRFRQVQSSQKKYRNWLISNKVRSIWMNLGQLLLRIFPNMSEILKISPPNCRSKTTYWTKSWALPPTWQTSQMRAVIDVLATLFVETLAGVAVRFDEWKAFGGLSKTEIRLVRINGNGFVVTGDCGVSGCCDCEDGVGDAVSSCFNKR